MGQAKGQERVQLCIVLEKSKDKSECRRRRMFFLPEGAGDGAGDGAGEGAGEGAAAFR